MFQKYLVLFLMLTACGADDGKESVTDKTQAETAPSEQTVTKRGDQETPLSAPIKTQPAIFIDDISALPPCTAAEEGWLAYAKTEAVFYACASSEWGAIDLQGPEGAKGDVGPAGAVVYNDGLSWPDPDTGFLWRVGGVGSACTAGHRSPTLGELHTASDHGIYLVLGVGKPDAYKLGWGTIEDGSFRRWDFVINGMRTDNVLAAAYCIKL